MLPDKSVHYLCVLFDDFVAFKIIFIFMLKFSDNFNCTLEITDISASVRLGKALWISMLSSGYVVIFYS